MTWPHREGFVVHIAAEPDSLGQQRCSRCFRLLHDGRTGAPVPWAPGTMIAMSEFGDVRMPVKQADPYHECMQAPAAAA
jgi:hypothetical protein